MTRSQAMNRLRSACAKRGDTTKLANESGIARCFIANVLAGRREPSVRLLAAIGIRKRIKRVVTYTNMRSKP